MIGCWSISLGVIEDKNVEKPLLQGEQEGGGQEKDAKERRLH